MDVQFHNILNLKVHRSEEPDDLTSNFGLRVFSLVKMLNYLSKAAL